MSGQGLLHDIKLFSLAEWFSAGLKLHKNRARSNECMSSPEIKSSSIYSLGAYLIARENNRNSQYNIGTVSNIRIINMEIINDVTICEPPLPSVLTSICIITVIEMLPIMFILWFKFQSS